MLLSKLSDKCPDDWKEFEDSCYFQEPEKVFFSEAKRLCKNRDAQVVTINSEEENQFVARWLSEVGKYGWLGMTRDETRDDTWMLLNGEEASFNKLSEWEYEDAVDTFDRYDTYKMCMVLTPGRWIPVSCDSLYKPAVICERPASE